MWQQWDLITNLLYLNGHKLLALPFFSFLFLKIHLFILERERILKLSPEPEVVLNARTLRS